MIHEREFPWTNCMKMWNFTESTLPTLSQNKSKDDSGRLSRGREAESIVSYHNLSIICAVIHLTILIMYSDYSVDTSNDYFAIMEKNIEEENKRNESEEAELLRLEEQQNRERDEYEKARSEERR